MPAVLTTIGFERLRSVTVESGFKIIVSKEVFEISTLLRTWKNVCSMIDEIA